MTKKLWGGRFKKQMNPEFYEFQKSIQYDHKLGMYDVFHSLIHIRALVHTNVLSAPEAYKLERALADILKDIKAGTFTYHAASEDIHTEIQNRLEAKVGDVALKLHSFRSRNDQIAFDVGFYCVHQAMEIFKLLVTLQENLFERARAYKQEFFVGYTHTRRAQVIKFSSYIKGFVSMLHRDQHRFDDFFKHTYIFIGAGALAGSYIRSADYDKAVKRFMSTYCKDLPVKISVVKNSLDHVSNRDAVITFLSTVATLQMHLSRMAEDFILYSTPEFGYLDLPEEFCTGSSYMPHKKNPYRVDLCSTTPSIVFKKIRNQYPNVSLVASNSENLITEQSCSKSGKLGSLAINAYNFQAGNLTPKIYKIIKNFGSKVYMWDLHEDDTLKQFCTQYDLDAVYSNYPDKARKILNENFD